MQTILIIMAFLFVNLSMGLGQGTSQTKQTLDSAVYMLRINPSEPFKILKKMRYQYNTDDKLIQEIRLLGSLNSNQLSLYQKLDFSYDTNQYLAETLESEYNGSQWYYTTKLANTYDSNGLLIENVSYIYFSNINQFVPDQREEYTYDGFENLIVLERQSWDSAQNVWILKDSATYTYDINHNLIEELVEFWNINSGQWVNQSKQVRTYNVNQELDTLIQYRWSHSANNWEPELKIEYIIYNVDSQLILTSTYNYDLAQGSWYHQKDGISTYDLYKNLERYVVASWIGTNWKDVLKFNHSYNSDYTSSDLIIPPTLTEEPYVDDIRFDFNHRLDSVSGWVWKEIVLEWAELKKWRFNYSSHFPVTVNEIGENDVRIYPNPFMDEIAFDLSGNTGKYTLEIYSIQGVLVLRQEISSNQKVNLHNFSRGVYTYRLSMGDKWYQGKVIKQ